MTSKSPVGDISVVTLIRTDTTLDHSQKAEKVWQQLHWFPPQEYNCIETWQWCSLKLFEATNKDLPQEYYTYGNNSPRKGGDWPTGLVPCGQFGNYQLSHTQKSLCFSLFLKCIFRMFSGSSETPSRTTVLVNVFHGCSRYPRCPTKINSCKCFLMVSAKSSLFQKHIVFVYDLMDRKFSNMSDMSMVT